MNSGYRILSESEGLWSFDNETARNVIFVDVYNSLSFHSENRKNNVLVLGEVPIFKRKS